MSQSGGGERCFHWIRHEFQDKRVKGRQSSTIDRFCAPLSRLKFFLQA